MELNQDLGVHIKICLYKFISDMYQQDDGKSHELKMYIILKFTLFEAPLT